MQLIVEKIGKFQRSERDVQMMSSLRDGRYQITIYTDEVRTLEQNRRYRLMIDHLADYCGYYKDEMHDVIKLSFGETTSVLNKKRHSELHHYVEAVCHELGIRLPRDSQPT